MRHAVGNSIQDQLLKAGLANKKQAVKARKAQNAKQKLQRTGKGVKDESTVLAEEASQRQTERDKALNKAKQAEAETKAVKAQIKQLIELNQISERGEVEFSFTHGSSIKMLALQKNHRDALISGHLAIVTLDNQYSVVPAPVCDKICQRDDSVLVLRNTSSETDNADDDYAGFEIPDDLMW